MTPVMLSTFEQTDEKLVLLTYCAESRRTHAMEKVERDCNLQQGAEPLGANVTKYSTRHQGKELYFPSWRATTPKISETDRNRSGKESYMMTFDSHFTATKEFLKILLHLIISQLKY
jgi:hypothetical protein